MPRVDHSGANYIFSLQLEFHPSMLTPAIQSRCFEPGLVWVTSRIGQMQECVPRLGDKRLKFPFVLLPCSVTLLLLGHLL